MRSSLLLFTVLSVLIACDQQGSKQPVTNGSLQDSLQHKTGFTNITACIFSEIVYCNDPQKEIDQFLPGWKVVWDPEAVGGNYAFVATDGNSYAIAIRGSLIEFSWAAFENWIYNDLNVASQKEWPYCSNGKKAWISKGAWDGWQNLVKLADKTSGKNLLSFLEANAGEKKSVVITGHSLGGNLATVYASYLRKMLKDSGKPTDNINVITFAAPAAGNKTFADDFNTSFPNSTRIENTNDIVPKFPVSDKVAGLGDLYSPLPAASEIMVGYKNLLVKLSTVFTMMSAALDLLQITNGLSPYVQTNGQGTLISIKLSGKNTANDIMDWFAEAGYQHGIERYAAAVGAPVITCNSK